MISVYDHARLRACTTVCVCVCVCTSSWVHKTCRAVYFNCWRLTFFQLAYHRRVAEYILLYIIILSLIIIDLTDNYKYCSLTLLLLSNKPAETMKLCCNTTHNAAADVYILRVLSSRDVTCRLAGVRRTVLWRSNFAIYSFTLHDNDCHIKSLHDTLVSELLQYRPRPYRPQTKSATDYIGHSLYHIGHKGNQYRPQTIGLCLLDFLHCIVLHVVCFKCFGTCYFNATVNLVSWSRFHHVFC